MADKRPVVIDCDPGVDDFLAIQLALNSPELEVQAITVTGGNTPLRYGVRNALRAVEQAGRSDIPVHAGSSRPLRGSFASAAAWHGRTGLTGRLPLPTRSASKTSAFDALAEILEDAGPDSVTVIALGPLTNIARLMDRRPRAFSRIGELVVMGGAVDVPGNVTPYAEFNIWDDPLAAQQVFRADIPTKLVGIDVCNEVRLAEADVANAQGAVGRVLRGWFRMRGRGDEMVLYDPVAVAVAIMPDRFDWESTPVDVIPEGEQKGRTVRGAGGNPIRLASGIDAELAAAIFRDRVLK